MKVFFFPYSLDGEHNRPSMQRPLKMLNAFKEMSGKGSVIEAVGKSRNLAMMQLQKDMKNGLADDIEFVYVESINKPLFLQCLMEKKINIFSDYLFFWQCKKHNIPLAIFYRDARWPKIRLRTDIPIYFFYFFKLAFYLEFKLFEYLFDVFFLPSIEMKGILPFEDNKVYVDELPPAVDFKECRLDYDPKFNNNDIALLYVGNINPASYNISPMIDAVRDNPFVTLDICCRKKDWDKFKECYELNQIKNIHIHHLDGKQLANLYEKTDVNLMYFADDEYRAFAVPFKLFESLQFGTPIITNNGTKVASLVHDMDVGWVVNDQIEIFDLIQSLCTDTSSIVQKKMNIARIIQDNTWCSRVEKVIEICQKIKH